MTMNEKLGAIRAFITGQDAFLISASVLGTDRHTVQLRWPVEPRVHVGDEPQGHRAELDRLVDGSLEVCSASSFSLVTQPPWPPSGRTERPIHSEVATLITRVWVDGTHLGYHWADPIASQLLANYHITRK